MSCVPKHIACEWYSPKIDAGFVAGNESCILQSFPETRGRLTAGGTFFRSVTFGAYSDNIKVTSTWQTLSGSPPTLPYINYNTGAPDFHTEVDVVRVELAITVGTDDPIYFYEAQSYTGGSPPWDVSAIPSLRSQLTNSSIVTMPTTDIGSIADGDHMQEIIPGENLTGGGNGNPVLIDIRTGPVLSMIFIDTSENITTGATITGNFGSRYWNGGCWKLDDLINPDCAGSPLDCSGDGCP